MLRISNKIAKYGYTLTRKGETLIITNGNHKFTYEGISDYFLHDTENVDILEYLILNKIYEQTNRTNPRD